MLAIRIVCSLTEMWSRMSRKETGFVESVWVGIQVALSGVIVENDITNDRLKLRKCVRRRASE